MLFGKMTEASAERGSPGSPGLRCNLVGMGKGKKIDGREMICVGTGCPQPHWKVPRELGCPSLLLSWRPYHRHFSQEQQEAHLHCSLADASVPAPKDEGVKTLQGNGS